MEITRSPQFTHALFIGLFSSYVILISVDSTQNCSLPTNKTMQIILSKVFTTYKICGFTNSISSINCIHKFFLLQLLFSYFIDSLWSLIIKNCDHGS